MAAIDLTGIRAVVFDTDGVVTDTARVHAAAWKSVFDPYLRGRSEPFDVREDYLCHVDGRTRLDGVRTFLGSRGLSPSEEDVAALGAAKDRIFVEQIERYGVAAFPSAVGLLHELRRRGSRTGAVSASAHCRKVVAAAALMHLFDVVIDGRHDQPGPASFDEAARLLDVRPEEIAVVGDTLPGIEAAGRGGFGLIVAIDRAGLPFKELGAHLVIADLAELDVTGRVRL
ncbi:HAD-IA family hydrolase [Nonomuraea sp. NPDC049152]|uniref:HAD family hydrolase n=1 Tax=Nonomuraea sp. NPDC049152 TaxID=3154350 RepID=UPI0033D6D30E